MCTQIDRDQNRESKMIYLFPIKLTKGIGKRCLNIVLNIMYKIIHLFVIRTIFEANL